LIALTRRVSNSTTPEQLRGILRGRVKLITWYYLKLILLISQDARWQARWQASGNHHEELF
jgi:hypothetical protein